ncbi:MAG: hypothetical protein ACRD2B_11430 [Terriglobia bacterium]
MPLRTRGIHIDPAGAGISSYWYKIPGQPGSDIERERTIVSTGAGWASQIKFYPACPSAGSWTDGNLINALLSEMHPDGRPSWFAAKDRLYAESKRLVEERWRTIRALAQALWAKPWTPRPPEKERTWSLMPDEKWINGGEVVSILQQFEIRASVVDDSVGTYTSAPEPPGILSQFRRGLGATAGPTP